MKMKTCFNCGNYIKRDLGESMPEVCIPCAYTITENGKEPSLWKPIKNTHADYIRGMTDEELAEYLANLVYDTKCGVPYSYSEERWLEWLHETI